MCSREGNNESRHFPTNTPRQRLLRLRVRLVLRDLPDQHGRVAPRIYVSHRPLAPTQRERHLHAVVLETALDGARPQHHPPVRAMHLVLPHTRAPAVARQPQLLQVLLRLTAHHHAHVVAGRAAARSLAGCGTAPCSPPSPPPPQSTPHAAPPPLPCRSGRSCSRPLRLSAAHHTHRTPDRRAPPPAPAPAARSRTG